MQFWSHLSNFLQGSLCSDPLPSILLQNFWNGFFGKGSSLRRVPWMIMTSPEYLLKSKQSKRCLPGNQLDKAAQERGHRVITHARQRTLSHHVSLQSRDAMASIPSFWHYATELLIGSPGNALSGIATWWQREKIFGNWHQWVGHIPGFPFEVSPAILTIVLVIVLDLLLVLVQLHLFLMIQLSAVVLETHTVWIWLVSIKGGKMETSHIRQRQRLSRYFYGRGVGLASTPPTLRHPAWLDLCFLISVSSFLTPHCLLQGTQGPDYQEPSGLSPWHPGNPGTW